MLMHISLSRFIPGFEKICYQEILFLPSNKRSILNKNYFISSRHLLHSCLTSTLVDRSSVYHRSQSYCSVMEQGQVQGLPLKVVVDKLNLFAPKSLAEPWDNVGLLVEPVMPKLIKKILLTNDLTEEVMKEAIEVQADLIISYHPPIFVPLKSVTTRTWKERIIAACLENKIALYSPHTSFDSVKGGVNDWLVSAFETTEVSPLVPALNNEESYLIELTFPNTSEGLAAVKEIETKWMEIKEENDGEAVCHTIPDTGEVKFVVMCTASSRIEFIRTCYSRYLTKVGENKSQLKMIKCEKGTIVDNGMGRMCTLKRPLIVDQVVAQVKNLIKVPYLKLALAVGKNLGSAVRTIAICAGSGASLLRGVKADLYLTGEMLHHDILDATHNGIHVILCNHSDSERGFLTPFSRTLSNELLDGEVQVIVSKRDKDPLITV